LSLSIETKKAVVEEIVAGIGNAQTMVLAEYRGISVASMTELRANARKEGVYLRVLKNTLARRAVEGTPFAGLAEHMVGPLVYAASEDAVAAAKVLHQFSKKDEKLIIKAGSYDGAVMDAAQVGQLAAIPSREELLSKLLFVMQAPVSGFARALAKHPNLRLNIGGSGQPEFERAVMQVAYQWTFVPATRNGRPVRAYATTTYRFAL